MSEKELVFNNKEKGNSGTQISAQVYELDYLSELNGVESHNIYNRMRRSDQQVRKVLTAITAPIKSATWSIPAISEEEQDIKAAALMERILFHDLDYDHKLGEILTFLAHGFSIFEVVHQNYQSSEFGAYTGLANLAFRNQATITEWKVDKKTSRLLEVHQENAGDAEIDVWLKTDTLLIFFNEREGDDNGFPLLRPLYGPYKRKLMIETLKMIGIERSAIPTPTLKVPQDIKVTDEEYKQATTLLSQFTSAENSYLTYPEGWELDLHQNSGFDPMKLEDSIKREDEKMVGAILATFLELGTGGNSGAYALGENLERFFAQVIASFAKAIANTINTKLIPNLMKLNYGDTIENYPKITFTGITDKVGEEFMRTVTGYTNAGVVSVDEPLEDYIRRVHNLPKKAEGEMVDNQETTGDENEVSSNSNDDPATNADPASSDELELKDKQEVIKLAEAKNPQSLISQESKEVSEVMRTNLQFIGDKLVADVVRKYKQLPESRKLNAIDNMKVGGTAKYKRQLRGTLTTVANKSLDMARAEVPEASDVKLKNNEEFFKLLDDYGTIKFADNEFSNLPAHVRKLLSLQSTRIVERQAGEIEDRVAFTFMQTEQTTDSAATIEKDLQNAVDDYVNAAVIDTAATNVSSTVVNQARNEFFFDDEVQEEIYAFKFNNFDPKSAICKKLAGSVFAKNDTEFLQYSPPLHHNCKSYLSVVLQTARNKPEIEPLPPITAEERKSITLSDKKKIERLLEVVENNCTRCD
jgi:phage gp29-like protein